MTGLFKGTPIRAVIGLIAAYAIALQTVFAALVPLPANALPGDIAGLHVLCFGSGSAAGSDTSDPTSPAPASGKFHCVLCGAAAASAAILPNASVAPAPFGAAIIVLFIHGPDFAPAQHSVRAGYARAPPLTA